MENYTQRRLKEIMVEFDIKQRLFLAGKYHSTAFNMWFQETFSSSIHQAEQLGYERGLKEADVALKNE